MLPPNYTRFTHFALNMGNEPMVYTSAFLFAHSHIHDIFVFLRAENEKHTNILNTVLTAKNKRKIEVYISITTTALAFIAKAVCF